MNSQIRYLMLKRLLKPFFLLVITFILYFSANAQVKPPEQPPRPIDVTVSNLQHLNFGTVIPTSIAGGSVFVDFNNNATPSGDVLLLHSYQCTAALFIVDAEPGVLFIIDYPIPNPTLGKGGFSITAHLGEPNVDLKPGTQFITRTKYTYVYIGGTLTVGSLSANPEGTYNGTFPVTFTQIQQ